MKTFKSLMFAAFIIAVLLVACKKDYTMNDPHGGNGNIQYLRFTSFPCLETPGLEKSLTGKFAVKGYDLEDNELTLHILYEANCCYDFKDDVTVTGNTVDIAITGYGNPCYCICNFINDFSFLYQNTDSLRVIFRIKSVSEATFSTEIDTLLYIQ